MYKRPYDMAYDIPNKRGRAGHYDYSSLSRGTRPRGPRPSFGPRGPRRLGGAMHLQEDVDGYQDQGYLPPPPRRPGYYDAADYAYDYGYAPEPYYPEQYPRAPYPRGRPYGRPRGPPRGLPRGPQRGLPGGRLAGYYHPPPHTDDLHALAPSPTNYDDDFAPMSLEDDMDVGEGDDDDINVDPSKANCTRKHPVTALIHTYPGTEFKQTMNISTSLGHAIGYQVEIDGKTFYGEGSTARIAKGLAALDALNYVKAPDVDKLRPVCNIYSEMKRCEEIKEQHKKMQASGIKKGNPTFKRQAVPPGRANLAPNPPHLVSFQLLRQKYVGANNEGDLVQTFTPRVSGALKDKTCVLIIQGHVFRGDGPNERIARDKAAAEALVFFEANPPDFVNSAKPKAEREPVYDRPDPKNYTDMLFCKAWKFVVELTKDVTECYVKKQNLAFVLKVYGEVQNIDHVDVVAVGSGAKVIGKDYMDTQGWVINDCGGDSLCIRAFRRYLINQLNNLMNGIESVFRKNPFGRIMMKEGFKFVFLTNCSPMGDCKNFDRQFYNMLRNKKAFDPTKEDAEMSINLVKSKKKSKKLVADIPFDPSDIGKLQVYRKMIYDHVPDQCMVPTPDIVNILHPIPSPSDKLALRNVCGIQGALLSNIIDPVFIPDFYVQRAFDQTSLERGLFGRLMGGIFPEGVGVKVPHVHELKWKPSRMADKTTVYCFLWCEGNNLDIIRSDIGSVVDLIKPSDTSKISEEMLRAYDSREIKSASPSKYCTYNYYTAICELLKVMKKPIDTYVNLKNGASQYQAAKQAVYLTFSRKGLGSWPIKALKPNF